MNHYFRTGFESRSRNQAQTVERLDTFGIMSEHPPPPSISPSFNLLSRIRMSLSNSARVRLHLEGLEDRAVPAIGTFVEDFSHNSHPNLPGFDYRSRGVFIGHDDNSAVIKATPAGGPAGKHSLLVDYALVPGGQHQGHYGAYPYGLNSWESVTSSSATVMGMGEVYFVSKAGVYHRIPVNSPNAWTTLTADESTSVEGGGQFGALRGIFFNTFGQLWVDNVTVHAEAGEPTDSGAAGVVRVNRFGNGLGIVGDSKNNYVRVDLLYDEAGTIQVSGPGVVAGPGTVQIDPFTVEVPDFAHFEPHEDQPDERDILINLHGGADQLIVAGADWTGPGRPRTVDDLIINVNSGDSITALSNLVLWDTLAYRAGSGQDTLGIFGKSTMNGLRVYTGAGNDVVQFGNPGARVFDGESPGDMQIGGSEHEPVTGVQSPDLVDTGPGNDRVLVSGGTYGGLSFRLGGGADQIRFESMVGYRLDVRPGAGSDRIDVIESNLGYSSYAQGRLTLFQDAGDTLRLDRFWNQSINLRGTSGIRVELPAGGTQWFGTIQRPGRPPEEGIYNISPGATASELRESLADILGPLSPRVLAHSSIGFSAEDF